MRMRKAHERGSLDLWELLYEATIAVACTFVLVIAAGDSTGWRFYLWAAAGSALVRILMG